MGSPFDEIRSDVAQLYAQKPERRDDVLRWAESLIHGLPADAVPLIAKPTDDVAQLVHELCQVLAGSRDTQAMFDGLAESAPHVFQSPDFDEDLRAVRRLVGLAEEIRAAFDAAIGLGWVEDDERAQVDATLSKLAVLASEAPHKNSWQWALVPLLAQLMLKAGYGDARKHKLSKARAAELLVAAARESGFDLTEDNLRQRMTNMTRKNSDDSVDLLNSIWNSRKA